MRILMVNTSERTGGAAIAANRLMNALCAAGEEARMLVRDKTTHNSRVTALPPSPLLKLKFVWERAEIFAANDFHQHRLFEVDHAAYGTDITRTEAFRWADVVHLHWTNQALLSLSDIRTLLQSGKPVVWTMHDMWSFTGICHYAHDCLRWQRGCGHCPVLYKGGRKDLSYRTFQRKEQAYAAGSMTMVACSDWLAELARTSPLLSGKPIHSIPNPIDTHLYTPTDQEAARAELGLPKDKKILLFVAYKATDPIKGIRYFQEAMRLLVAEREAWQREVHIVVVGREATALQGGFPCPTTTFEYISLDTTMRTLYNAATLLCMPTTSDNLPNTIVEAMACGLPVVGFRVGGLPQMIDSGNNGYLAAPRSATDFAEGIRQSLRPEALHQYPIAARRKAVRHYSEEVVAEKYLRLYQHCMSLSK